MVETRIGRLELADGVPTPRTASVLWDHLDVIRDVETFLHGIPSASLDPSRTNHMDGRPPADARPA